MIKNQLYPYIEKYINEYLYGFSKEQLDVGVMNGTILIEKVNIRVDKANEKLDSQNIPIWIKAGLINKIKVGCSLMNFLGEKPLEAEIDEIEVLVCPSCRWILANINSFIDENEEFINEPYDPNDNNSYDIFTKKLSLFDGSIFKKKPELLEFLKDKSKLTEIIHKLLTKVMNFYYQSSFFINLKINKVHIRFEDDIFNFFGGTIIGVKLDSIEIALSAEGKLKKDSLKVTNLNVYVEDVLSLDNFFVTSTYFLSQLNKDGIGKEYYDSLDEIYRNIKTKAKTHEEKRINMIKDFNFMAKFGIQNQDSNLNIFTNAKDKSLKAYFFIATSDLVVSINPNFIGKLTSLKDYFKCYYLNEQIQQYKPMRKPYNLNNDVVKSVLNNPNFELKRKLIARDWIYYFVMFSKFKKAMYNKPFNNKLQEEFSKYFNICCSENLFPDTMNDAVVEDDKSVAASRLSKGTLTTISKITDIKKNKQEKEKEKNKKGINPDNISLSFSLDLNCKSIKIQIYESYTAFVKKKDYLLVTLDSIKAKITSNMKDDFNLEVLTDKINFSTMINGEKIGIQIQNSIENQIVGSSKTRNNKDSNIINPGKDLNSIFLEGIQGHETKELTRRTQFIELNTNKLKQLNDALSKVAGKDESKNLLINNFIEEDDEEYGINDEPANNKQSLLSKIKEHNIKKQVKSVVKKDVLQKTNTMTIQNQNENILLDLGEFKSIKFNMTKENVDYTQVNDTYSLFIDSLRLNLSKAPVKKLINIFSGYELLLRKILYNKKIEKDSQQSNLLNMNIQSFNLLEETPKDSILRYSYELQNVILNKLQNQYELPLLNIAKTSSDISTNKLTIKTKLSMTHNPLSKTSPSEFIKDYYSHLNAEIGSYDKLLLKEGKYQLNYLFYILHKKRIDINFLLKSFILTAFNEDIKKNNKLIGKLTMPHNQIKFKISPQKILLVLNETEVEYYDVEAWRSIVDNTLQILNDKIKVFQIDTLEPFIDLYYKEQCLDSKNVERKLKMISTKSKNRLVENEELELSNANI